MGSIVARFYSFRGHMVHHRYTDLYRQSDFTCMVVGLDHSIPTLCTTWYTTCTHSYTWVRWYTTCTHKLLSPGFSLFAGVLVVGRLGNFFSLAPADGAVANNGHPETKPKKCIARTPQGRSVDTFEAKTSFLAGTSGWTNSDSPEQDESTLNNVQMYFGKI